MKALYYTLICFVYSLCVSFLTFEIIGHLQRLDFGLVDFFDTFDDFVVLFIAPVGGGIWRASCLLLACFFLFVLEDSRHVWCCW